MDPLRQFPVYLIPADVIPLLTGVSWPPTGHLRTMATLFIKPEMGSPSILPPGTPTIHFKHCLKHSFFLWEEFLEGKG